MARTLPLASSSPRRTRRLRLLSLAIATAFSAPGSVLALPTGATVVAGAANITRSGNALTVANTPGAIINWSSFSIGALESVRFQQQTPLSSVLNRVTGGEASAIHGALGSNASVWLINPNGILFGAGSRVDIPGFVASSLAISDADFRAGRMNFAAGPVARGIRNDGVISNAGHGSIYLLAPDITNAGIIQTQNGDVILAAGRQISLVDGAHPDVQVMVSAPRDQALNLGRIAAPSGRVSLFGALLAQRGEISADTAEVDAAGRIVFRGSQVRLEGHSTTSARGVGSRSRGGEIDVLGDQVAVIDQARVDVSGEHGGGRIRLGGDYQGNNPAIPNARRTELGADASLKADALKVGAGGTAIVWADDTSIARGTISATGGREGGDGGFVETSAHSLDVYGARVDTRAPRGNTGQWLLDPTDITIIGVGGPITDATLAGGTYTGTATANTIVNADLNTALGTSNIVVSTASAAGGTGNITVNAPIGWSNANTLTLDAACCIQLNAGISSPSGTLVLNSGTTISQGTTATAIDIATLKIQAGGAVTLSDAGNTIGTLLDASLTGSASGFSLTNDFAGNFTIGSITTANGPVSIQATSYGGSMGVGSINAGTAIVNLQTSRSILDNNGSGNNITAGALLARSFDGPVSNATLAISLDTKVTSLDLEAQGSFGGINLRNISANLSAAPVVGTAVTLKTSGSLAVPGAISSSAGNTTLDIGNALSINGGTVSASGNVGITMRGTAGVSLSSYGGIVAGNANGNTSAQTSITFTTLTGNGLSIDGTNYANQWAGLIAPNTISSIQHYDAQNVQHLSSTQTTAPYFGGLVLNYAAPPPPPPPPVFQYSVNTTLAAGTASHTYGQQPTAQLAYALAGGVQAGDTVSGTPSFTPTINNLTSAGSFTVLYAGGLLSSLGSSFLPGSGLTYVVDPAMLSVSLAGVAAMNKVYDGKTRADFSGGALSGLVNNDIVVFILQGDFADRHAANGKRVTLNNAALSGSAASNYRVVPFAPATFQADISQRPSVAWVAGDGVWSAAANWTEGALPDRSNVAVVSLPPGARVEYDAGVEGATRVQRIDSAGELAISAGSLEVSEALNTVGFAQSGGALAGSGRFAASSAFSKTGGLFTMSGPLRATQAAGDLLFVHDSAAEITALNAPAGRLTVINTGAITVTGDGLRAHGDIDVTARSPLTIDASVISASGGIRLTAGYVGTLTLTGNAKLVAPGPISLSGTGPLVGLLPAGADYLDNSGSAPLPHGSLEQSLNCLLNPGGCLALPSPDTQQIIDTAVFDFSLNQFQIADSTGFFTTNPTLILESGSQPDGITAGGRLSGSRSPAGGVVQTADGPREPSRRMQTCTP